MGKAIENAFAGPSKSAGQKAGDSAGDGFSKGFGAKLGIVSGIASSVATKVIGVFSGLSGADPRRVGFDAEVRADP